MKNYRFCFSKFQHIKCTNSKRQRGKHNEKSQSKHLQSSCGSWCRGRAGKGIGEKDIQKTKKCIKNKKTEDTINKMVDAAVDGIPNAELDKLVDEAMDEAVTELLGKNNKKKYFKKRDDFYKPSLFLKYFFSSGNFTLS